jgi:uncharacterized Zn finger protein (UPF0148 family)
MKATVVEADGTVRCPTCGATTFTSGRTAKGLIAGGIVFAPRRLKCAGCGTHLKTTRPRKGFKKAAAEGKAKRSAAAADLAERKAAKAEAKAAKNPNAADAAVRARAKADAAATAAREAAASYDAIS